MGMPVKRYKFLIASNIALLLLLLASVIHEQYPQRVYRRLFEAKKTYTYSDNPFYQQQKTLYPLYRQQKNIVLLGDSYISNMSWAELLERCDVASRGVNYDLTSGMVHRLNAVLALQPRLCFIAGGANDLGLGIPPKIIVRNLNRMADTLLAHQALPVLHTINRVAAFTPGADTLNESIRLTNLGITRLAQTKNLPLIDLDALLSENGFLSPAYAHSDGTHLNAQAYRIWKLKIEAILEDSGFGL